MRGVPGSFRNALDSALAELAALTLGETAPDSEPLIVLQCILQALRGDLARFADSLRFASRSTLLRKERFRVGLGAQRVGLPGQNCLVFAALSNARNTEEDGIYEPV